VVNLKREGGVECGEMRKGILYCRQERVTLIYEFGIGYQPCYWWLIGIPKVKHPNFSRPSDIVSGLDQSFT